MLFGFFNLSPPEMIVIGIVAVLLFGSRLPGVARSVCKSVTESASSSARRVTSSYDDHEEPTAPKFEPPTSEPKDETVQA